MTETSQTTNAKQDEPRSGVRLVIVLLLGVATLATAWSGWMGAMHSANSDTHQAAGQNLLATGTARYNVGADRYSEDIIAINAVLSLMYEHDRAVAAGDQAAADAAMVAMDNYLYSAYMDHAQIERLTLAIRKTNEIYTATGQLTSPFADGTLKQTYFTEANQMLAASDAEFAKAAASGASSGAYAMVAVFYAIVLFFAGIANGFTQPKPKWLLVGVGTLGWLATTIWMATLPLPM